METRKEPLVGGAAAAPTGQERADSAEPDRAARSEERPGVRPAPDAADADRVWRATDVATYLEIPLSSIYKMTARKAAVRIPHIRIGGKLRFRKSDIDRWLTLLTVSNIKTLSKMRQALSEVNHGNHS